MSSESAQATRARKLWNIQPNKSKIKEDHPESHPMIFFLSYILNFLDYQMFLVSVPVHVNIHLSESKKIPRAEALGIFLITLNFILK